MCKEDSITPYGKTLESFKFPKTKEEETTKSFFEIAQRWLEVTDEEVQYFKDGLYKECPDAPRGPLAPQWTPPGPVECCEDNGCVSNIDKYWLSFPGSQVVYTINNENKFAKK